MSELQKTIRNFSDEYLLEQYNIKKDEYTDDALSIMEEEILRRNLNISEKGQSLENGTDEKAFHNYPIKDFVPIVNSFHKKEVLLARDILTEEDIPGIIESNNTLDIDEAELYSILVPGDLLEKTRECILKYFIESDGVYKIKYNDATDRLKAFNFHELQFTGTELDEEIDVEFSDKESREILNLIRRLISEADRIEENGKILFYYDNLETCESHFSNIYSTNLTRSDLLTVLEVLQVYCEDENLSSDLLNTAKSLLDFFSI
ncbi:MAG: hypothetical protein PVI26_04900 [Chitinispirillia bacterium]|jgi:hypothetical protein